MPKRKKQHPGYYWYFDDWQGDVGVQQLSYTAKGLWRDMLDTMHQVTPQGVLPGDLELLAVKMGFSSPLVRKAWAAEVAPLIEEIEAAGVLSRGHEVATDADPIKGDAIVCRKIYRAWLKAEIRRRKAQAAADARWQREAEPEPINSHETGDTAKMAMLGGMLGPMLGGMPGVCSEGCSADSVSEETPETCDDGGMLGGCRSLTLPPTLPNIDLDLPNKTYRSKADTPPDDSNRLDRILPGGKLPAAFDVERLQNEVELSALNQLAQYTARTAQDDSFLSGDKLRKLQKLIERPDLHERFVDELGRIQKQSSPDNAKRTGETLIARPGGVVYNTLDAMLREVEVSA